VVILERDLQTLAAAKDAWARLSVERKIGMLERVKRLTHATAHEWVALAAQAKGLRPDSQPIGEEWISGPWALLYALNRYLRTLRGISARGEAPLPPARLRDGGRTVLRVFPRTVYDRLLLGGISAEVWMRPGVTPAQVPAEACSLYRTAQPRGRVVLVLGAGNIASIAPLDVLYKMLAEGAVCMLKMHPVNAYLGPVLERIFAEFVADGFLRFAYGGAGVGAQLAAHALVEEIHVTGSKATHDAIFASVGSTKRITSELGNVSPTIVLPGPWSDNDVAFQAENIATQKAHNAGFNCVAAQVLILPKAWKHAAALRDRVSAILRTLNCPQYYPGAAARLGALVGADAKPGAMVDVDPQDFDHPLVTTEAFCGVLACVELPGELDSYVRDAVAFANDKLAGTLGANLIVHPRTSKTHARVVEQAVTDLRYGCVAVNGWTGIGYFLTETPWGAYPGHTPDNAGSGIGVVHNAYFLERTEKTVIYAPFSPFPRPPWFVTNAMQAQIGRALCDFEAAPSPARAAHVAALALRG